MSHARKTIRSAIATILRTAPTNWASVSESRIQSQRQIWPYLMVFAEDEASSAATANGPTVYDRSITIIIVGLLKLPGTGDTQTVEDRMDSVSEEIETKLTQAVLRAAVVGVKSVSLIATKMDVIIEDDGIDHAEILQTWQVNYFTLEGIPQILL